MNFSAFHSAGLWLAVMAIPPCAAVWRTPSCTVGVGHTPMSTMRLPAESRPAMTACRTISPDVRVSRPTTIRPGPMAVPNAWAKRVSRTGVSESPTTPRTPEMEILRVGMARMQVHREVVVLHQFTCGTTARMKIRETFLLDRASRTGRSGDRGAVHEHTMFSNRRSIQTLVFNRGSPEANSLISRSPCARNRPVP